MPLDMPTVSFRVDEDEKEALEAEARKRGISRSKHLKQIIQRRGQGDVDREELQKEIERLERELEEVTQQRDLARHQLSVVSDTPVNQYVDATNEMLEDFRETVMDELREMKKSHQSRELKLERQKRKSRELDIKRLENHRDDLAGERDRIFATKNNRLGDIVDRLDWIDAELNDIKKPRRHKIAEWLLVRLHRLRRFLSPF